MQTVEISGQRFTYDGTFRPLPSGQGEYAGVVQADGSILGLTDVDGEKIIQHFRVENGEIKPINVIGVHAELETVYLNLTGGANAAEGYLRDSDFSASMVRVYANLYNDTRRDGVMNAAEVAKLQTALNSTVNIPSDQIQTMEEMERLQEGLDNRTEYRNERGELQSAVVSEERYTMLSVARNNDMVTYAVLADGSVMIASGRDAAEGKSTERVGVIPPQVAQQIVAAAKSVNLDGVQDAREAQFVQAITNQLDGYVR